MNLKLETSSVLIILVSQCIISSCIPQLSNIHKRLSKDQLKKYFDVHNHEEVPEYNFVSIRMRRSNPFYRLSSDPYTQRNGISSKDLFIMANSIFGHSVEMQLRRNDDLLAPAFKVSKIGDDGTEMELKHRKSPLCHYIGTNGTIAAAVSSCEFSSSKGLSGIMLLPDGGVQIQPVDQDLSEILGLHEFQEKRSSPHNDEEMLHLVFRPHKRLSVPDEKWEDEHYIPSAPRSEYELDDDDIVKYLDFDDLNSMSEGSVDTESKKPTDVSKRASSKDLFLELAVFFDEKGYELFMPHVKTEDNMVDLLLGFVNQMQALYQQPSLNKKIQISLVKMELMKKQPSDLPHSDGERDELLDAFCKYQAKRNPDSDNDPNHWDIALYISGLNFYSMEKGKRNGVTMGLAPVGGVCMKKHSCVITEFGTTSDNGRPYPSAGLLSTYIAVHEIGHNLGMFHDGPPNNDCPANGHVMSPSRGTKGETTWSSCSSKVLEKSDKKCLYDAPQATPGKGGDHSKYNEKPGQVWDAHDQCKIFLRDEDATLLNETVVSMVCEETLCKTPQRIGYYAAGPALEGTYCGSKKWCRNGQCVSWGSEKLKVVKGGWSNWDKGGCQSGCIKSSRAVTTDKRYCNNPKPRNTEKYCEGDNIRIHFCDDSKKLLMEKASGEPMENSRELKKWWAFSEQYSSIVLGFNDINHQFNGKLTDLKLLFKMEASNLLCKKRIAPTDYAKERCDYFSTYISDITPVGVQVKYNEKREWQACAVYCKMKSGTWYTPRQEFNDMGIDTFFPEGTWCHNDGRTDYFCQNRLCLPPPVKGRSAGSLDPAKNYKPIGRGPEVDVPVFNNAHPKGNQRAPKKLTEYFQYQEGKLSPLPGPEELGRPKEEDYEIVDYVSPRL